MWTIIKNDIRTGTRKNTFKYFVCIVFTIVVCILFTRRTEHAASSGILPQGAPCAGDYILYIFGGMNWYNSGKNAQLEIPYIWMSIQLLVCSCVFSYPVRDIYGKGTSILLHSGSRTQWWLCKCLWAVEQVFTVYICILTGIFLSSFLFGSVSMHINTDAFRLIEGVYLKDNVSAGFSMLVPPLLYSITITMIQIAISLICNPAVSLAAIVLYDVLSVYSMSPYILGNISMLYRNSAIITSGGISVTAGTIISACASAAAILTGTYYFRHYDILKR